MLKNNLVLNYFLTCIQPFYSTNEPFGSDLPIEVHNSILPLGPIYITKTVLSPNNDY